MIRIKNFICNENDINNIKELDNKTIWYPEKI